MFQDICPVWIPLQTFQDRNVYDLEKREVYIKAEAFHKARQKEVSVNDKAP